MSDNPFNFFDKIFCINLQKRTDRWTECLKIFEELNISTKVERFEAINFEHNNNIPQSIKGKCGCTQSHLDIILKAQKEKYNNVLIFEDDIKLHTSTYSIHNTLKKCINELPNSWEIFYLSANPLNHVLNNTLSYSENLCVVTAAFTTHAIAINHTAYNLIAQKYEEMNYNSEGWGGIINIVNKLVAIDGFYMSFIHPRHNTYMPKKLLFTQRHNYSDLDYCDRDINSIIIETYKQNPLLMQ